MGTLKLRQEKPEQYKRELIQFDHRVLWKRPKCGPWAIILKITNMEHVLDIFSVLCDQIELIPLFDVQASHDAILEYPQRVFWNEIFINFVKDL